MGQTGYGIVQIYRSYLNGKPIDVYNYGEMKRDFTSVEDLATAIILLVNHQKAPKDGKSRRTISNSQHRQLQAENLMDYIRAIEL